MCLCIRTRQGSRLICIHKLYLRIPVVCTIKRQLHLKSFKKLKISFDIQFVGLRPYRRRCLAIVSNKPTTGKSFLYITFVHKTECKIQTGTHRPVRRTLTEYIAYIWIKQRQRHSTCILETYRHIPW